MVIHFEVLKGRQTLTGYDRAFLNFYAAGLQPVMMSARGMEVSVCRQTLSQAETLGRERCGPVTQAYS